MKVLCLSFWSPPVVRPQAILLGKMIPEWIKQDIEPVLVTYDTNLKWDIDLPIYFVPQLKLNKYFNKFVPKFIKSYFINFYYARVISIVKKVIEKHKPDIMFSFANPQDSNIVGMMIKEKISIPFVSHFSDPWVDNPYKFSEIKRPSQKDVDLEKNVIDKSDFVIFVNNQLRHLVMKKYPGNWLQKTAVIPHCFNEQDYPEVLNCKAKKFVFSHVGAFYKERNLELFFQALHKLFKNEPKSINLVELVLVGAINDYAGYNIENINKMLIKYDLDKITKIIPPVSYFESLRFMKMSDCLVVVDADFPNSPFLPSKVIDYVGSRNLILGITPDDSPTAEVLDKLGFYHFNYSQIDNLVEHLRNLIFNDKCVSNNIFLDEFNVRNTTANLIKIFHNVSYKK